MSDPSVRHEHWIIGVWHISVDLIGQLWTWRVDHLNLARDPMMLRGEGLPSLELAILLTLNAASRTTAFYGGGEPLSAVS